MDEIIWITLLVAGVIGLMLGGGILISLLAVNTYNGVVSSYQTNNFVIVTHTVEFYGGAKASWIGGQDYNVTPQEHCNIVTRGDIWLVSLSCKV